MNLSWIAELPIAGLNLEILDPKRFPVKEIYIFEEISQPPPPPPPFLMFKENTQS